jgi:hypothetical protein
VLLLKQVDDRLGLTHVAALALGDECRSASVHNLLAQRIYGLCLGWSDVCDQQRAAPERPAPCQRGQCADQAAAGAAAPGLAQDQDQGQDQDQDHRAGDSAFFAARACCSAWSPGA